jgi:hypothetical protein
MPVVPGQLTANGAVVDLLVGVHGERRENIIRMGMQLPARARAVAQIDTGADYCAVDRRILEKIEKSPYDRIAVRNVSTNDNPVEFDRYLVSLSLDAEGMEMHLPLAWVLAVYFTPEEGIQALLGRDILKHCLFTYDGPSDRFCIAF